MKNINKTKDEYTRMVKSNQPPINKFKNIIKAYIVGGLICVLGQGLWQLFMLFNMSQTDAGTMSTVTLIFLGGLLTGIGVYDEIGQFAGAGSIVPVTGFANAMVSPALEYKQDGYILGLGAKLFTVAGPVLTYGMVSAFIIGLLKVIMGG
ncbi:stage V sporulation protein AC [Halothermothrix orenii]|uniref:Sporulation stage V protein AC n=1 Tax=Halothermothrix orenii (strain H 168 / OCM 544 / DSM 9562) TaxID=373903 RepID=B8CVZ3_HALOH|nr:stage V sporulation protein AC [Halothermothrix orenii]ACL69462.1 Sporulation stage V protein AC [Halothermothrix orenii H 168]